MLLEEKKKKKKKQECSPKEARLDWLLTCSLPAKQIASLSVGFVHFPLVWSCGLERAGKRTVEVGVGFRPTKDQIRRTYN